MYTFDKTITQEIIAENGNFASMSKAVIHIGKKIKEVLDQTPLSVVDFAKSINLTRNGAYKVFDKETIDTGQLQNIAKVLKHDFFSYYEPIQPGTVRESKTEYGYATKHEMTQLTETVKLLTIAIENLREQLPKKKASPKKKAKR